MGERLDWGLDLEASERWVDDWEQQAQERARRAQALAQRVSQLSCTARSPSGFVEVTVSSAGVLTGLRLDERVRQQPAARTAEEVLATLRQALSQLATEVRQATADTIGLDTETGQAVVSRLTGRFGGTAEQDRDPQR